jgi:hypothetical protein
MGTDHESRCHATDDERRVSTGDESFVELSNSQSDLTSKLADSKINKGYLYHKESDGLRQRWFTLDGNVLKCYKRQNQSLLFEVNFSEGGYSAIQGRIAKMFAIRLSGTKASSSHLFASPKVDLVASWMMALSSAGVRLQDEILREVREGFEICAHACSYTMSNVKLWYCLTIGPKIRGFPGGH